MRMCSYYMVVSYKCPMTEIVKLLGETLGVFWSILFLWPVPQQLAPFDRLVLDTLVA